jgi:uncharacterized membrane protein YfcA
MRTSRLAFLYSVPIAALGGLIGLGGAEFRLPVLAGPLGYSARRAVPLNLAVSLITISAAFLIRGQVLSLKAISPLLPAIFALIGGAVVAAFYGPSLAHKLSDERLERVILFLLLAIGMALIVESFLPQKTAGLLPAAFFWHVCAGIFFGFGIGLVSSLLGVAGGEMIIPTLVFAFGANIKTAGTASLLISFPTISVGLLRYAKNGAFSDRRPLSETVAPMGIGSIIGAIVGGLLVGIAPVSVLKLMLGVILIISALRIFSKQHGHSSSTMAKR